MYVPGSCGNVVLRTCFPQHPLWVEGLSVHFDPVYWLGTDQHGPGSFSVCCLARDSVRGRFCFGERVVLILYSAGLRGAVGKKRPSILKPRWAKLRHVHQSPKLGGPKHDAFLKFESWVCQVAMHSLVVSGSLVQVRGARLFLMLHSHVPVFALITTKRGSSHLALVRS